MLSEGQQSSEWPEVNIKTLVPGSSRHVPSFDGLSRKIRMVPVTVGTKGDEGR